MAHYDDSQFDYQSYWQNRQYEHQSEVLAIRRLLAGHHFSKIGDVGGGFGRLFPTLAEFSQQVYLLEPSRRHLSLAKKLYGSNKKLKIIKSSAQNIPLPQNSLDLVSLIRVSHHLPDLSPTFSEIYRILKPHGYFLLEFANSANIKARLANPFLPVSRSPIERRSLANIKRKTISFVNHYPQSVLNLLTRNHFAVENILSVSNFRSPFLKNILPLKLLNLLESGFQIIGARFFFGPSIFVMAKKMEK